MQLVSFENVVKISLTSMYFEIYMSMKRMDVIVNLFY